MSRLTNYILFMSSIILMFYFFGLLQGTPTSGLLSILLAPSDLSSSELYTIIVTVVGVVIAGGAIAFALVQRADFVIIAPMVILLLSFGWDFISVVNAVYAANAYLAVFLFSGFMIVYILTVVEWWRGVDTGG